MNPFYTLKKIYIDATCYYVLESHFTGELRSTIHAGDMFLTEYYKEEEDVQQIINTVIEELKLRAKISRSHRTLYNIERLLPKIEKLTKNE